MNYLAHTLLSKKDIDYQIANLLSDHLKGRAWDGCSQAHLDGLAMHRAIDQFTDNHPYFRQAKQRLGAGYLRGVVLDILFDHFLSQQWSLFVTLSLDEFSQCFYLKANQAKGRLTPEGKDFIRRVIKYDFFHLYKDFSGLARVFAKFDERLSARVLRKECSSDYLPLIKTHYQALEADFLLFFPELIRFFVDKSLAVEREHYFKGAVYQKNEILRV